MAVCIKGVDVRKAAGNAYGSLRDRYGEVPMVQSTNKGLSRGFLEAR